MSPVGGGQEERNPPRTDAYWSRLRTKPIRANSGWTCLLLGDGYPIPRYHKTWALIVSPQSRWWDRPDSNRHHVGLCGPDALPFALLSHMGRPAALLAGRLREDCSGEAGIEPAFLGGKVSKPLSSAAATKRRQNPGGMPRSRQRGSDALGDHFDLARNPVPD